MAKFSLRRYDNQALVSIVISLASLVALLGLAFIAFQNTVFPEGASSWKEYLNFDIPHGKNRKMAVAGGTAMTLLLAAVGFGMGLNSAGQRRNDKQKWSWIGFFMGAVVLCLTIIVFLIFRERGESLVG